MGGQALIALLLSLAVAGGAWAQDAARGLAESQSAALKAGPTTAPTAASVPGFAGEAAALQSFAEDPDRLRTAGAASISTTPAAGMAQSALGARASAGVDRGADWLASALAAHADPMAKVAAGDATVTGDERLTCREETRTETVVTHALYTCETSTAVAVSHPACREIFAPEISDTRLVCTETWDGTRFSPSESCRAASDRNCAAGPRTCTTPSTPIRSPYACQEGYAETTSTQVNPYACETGYVETTGAQTSSYACTEGYVGGATTASCSGSLSPSVQYATQATCALPSPLYPYDQCAAAWGMPRAGCVRIDESFDAAGGHWATFACDPYIASDGYSDSCSALAGCSQLSSVCTSGPATYSYEGVPVHRDCWAWSYVYSCPGGRVDAPGCAPPPGAELVGSTCSGQTDGACTQWDRQYRVTTVTTTRTPMAGCAPPGSCAPTRQSCAAYDASGACTATRHEYTCTEAITTRSPAAGCAPGADCTLVSSTCSATDAAGTCTQFDRHYACVSDPAGGCAQWDTPYACRHVTGSTWTPEGACAAAGDATCATASVSCLEGAATRWIDGAYVTTDCWRRETTYQCVSRTQTDNCRPGPDCAKVGEQCLDDADGPYGCLTVDHAYQCTTTTSTTHTQNRCETRMCLGDSCFDLRRDADGDFAQVYSQLAALQQAGRDYGANPDFSIFKGKPLKCAKAVLGFANCCKDSGWGLDIGLARCSSDERQLISEQDHKATHYVGTYCSNSSLFGVCLEKKMTYCGFGTALPRIVNEAGRMQVGKGWGTAKSPDCSGFSIDQFQTLDLTNVDFSDFYREKLAGFASPDSGATAARIQQSLEGLYSTGEPRPQ